MPKGWGTGWAVTVANVDPATGKRQASQSLVDQVGVVGRVVYAAPVVAALRHPVGASPATGGFALVIIGTWSLRLLACGPG